MPIEWQLYTVFFFVVVAVASAWIVADNRRQRVVAYTPGRATAEAALAARVAADEEQYATFRHWQTDRIDGTHIQVIPLIRPAPVVSVDERTAEVLAAPDLTAHDLIGVVEQVAPGTGSLGSFTAAVEDTKMRTSVELAALHAAEVEAYDAIEAEEVRLFMAGFDRAVGAALDAFDAATGRVDMWAYYLHESGTDGCPRCEQAVHEVSAEHKKIVSGYDTGAYDLTDLRTSLRTLSVA